MTFLLWLFARWGVPESGRRPLVIGLAAAAAIALFGAASLYLTKREEADDRANREIGAALQRANDLAETLDRVEDSNALREEIRDPASRTLHDECLRSARTPANCERLLPRGQEAHD